MYRMTIRKANTPSISNRFPYVIRTTCKELDIFREKNAFKCDVCEDCPCKRQEGKVCVCFSCGHMNTYKKDESRIGNDEEHEEELFKEEIDKQSSNLLYMDRIDRLITGGIENTYMPLI